MIVRLRDQVQELLTFFSGHDNEVIQMWDLQTAGVVFKKGHGKGQESNASLNGHEMAKLIDSSRRLQL